MADTDFSITIRFDGLDAEDHEIDLFALGEALQGLARVAATVGHFEATQKYSRYFRSHDLKVLAREPRPNCFSIDLVWNFVQQHQILSGSFGVIVVVLIPWLFSRAANRTKEMKHLKDSLDKAIEKLAQKDEKTVERLLGIVERMAVDLKPAMRRSVAPIGGSAKTMTIVSENRTDTFNESDKAEILKTEDEEITEVRPFGVLITELDLERGSAKVHIEGEAEDRRVSVIITDPLLQKSNNPYSLAMAAGEVLPVQAKAMIGEGEIVKLFISDVGS